MLTNYKYQPNFNFVFDVSPVKQGTRQNWTFLNLLTAAVEVQLEYMQIVKE